jgi:hypothetical protein
MIAQSVEEIRLSSTAVVFNLEYEYPGCTRRHLRGYSKTSYGVCKVKEYITS